MYRGSMPSKIGAGPGIRAGSLQQKDCWQTFPEIEKMEDQQVESNGSTSATIEHGAATSNAPGGNPLGDPTPRVDTIVYEGQKVPISINTNNLAGDSYTDVQFCVAVDDEKHPLQNPDGISPTGTAVHPDSMGKLIQPVVSSQSDYGIDIVIQGKGGEIATWNVYITGSGATPPTPLKYKPDVQYVTKDVSLNPLWAYEFLLPGNNTQATNDDGLHISAYQVMDEMGAAVQKPFSARIFLSPGSEQADLTCLHFFDASKTEIRPTADKQSVWIDSDAQGVLDFYVTANTPLTSWNLVMLTMDVGTEGIVLPGLIIVDLAQVPKDAQVDPPAIDGASGQVNIDPSGPPMGVIVPSTTISNGQIHVDDTLFLGVNGVVLPETGKKVVPNDQNVILSNQPFFQIAPSLLNYSSTGGDNKMLILIVRPENGAVKSTEYTFAAFGDENDSGTVSPFPVGDQKFPPLSIVGFGPSHVINSQDIKNGLTAKISWASWLPQYKPNLNDTFTIYGLIAGYDRYSIFRPVIFHVTSLPVTQDDLNSDSMETPIDSPSLRGWSVGPNGEKSTIILQFKAGNEYSKATPQYTIYTLRAGGV
jgi:hypothetical protein